MPIFRATGEQDAEPELLTSAFVNVNDGEISLPAGGDVETETVGAFFLKRA